MCVFVCTGGGQTKTKSACRLTDSLIKRKIPRRWGWNEWVSVRVAFSAPEILYRRNQASLLTVTRKHRPLPQTIAVLHPDSPQNTSSSHWYYTRKDKAKYFEETCSCSVFSQSQIPLETFRILTLISCTENSCHGRSDSSALCNLYGLCKIY